MEEAKAIGPRAELFDVLLLVEAWRSERLGMSAWKEDTRRAIAFVEKPEMRQGEHRRDYLRRYIKMLHDQRETFQEERVYGRRMRDDIDAPDREGSQVMRNIPTALGARRTDMGEKPKPAEEFITTLMDAPMDADIVIGAGDNEVIVSINGKGFGFSLSAASKMAAFLERQMRTFPASREVVGFDNVILGMRAVIARRPSPASAPTEERGS